MVTIAETIRGHGRLHNNVSFSVACDLDAVLIALEGDRDLLLRMIQVFLDESPALRERTQQALAARDATALARAAHTLRGALANFAARDAGATAQLLEERAAHDDWRTSAAAYARLENQMDKVVQALQAFAAGAKP